MSTTVDLCGPQVFVTTLISLTVYTAPDQTGSTPGQHLRHSSANIEAAILLRGDGWEREFSPTWAQGKK